jgi:hypothetical protein
VVLQKNGKVASQPIHDLVTANGACHGGGAAARDLALESLRPALPSE